MERAIQMRAKRHATLRYGAKLAKGHDLVATRVGEDWSIPPHEPMQAAKLRDPFCTRPQHQVIGIS